jgi:hypothetical protein
MMKVKVHLEWPIKVSKQLFNIVENYSMLHSAYEKIYT